MINLIVIGDSQFEMKAGKYFKKKSNLKKRCFLKLIKLKEDPTAEQLERQLNAINSKFDYFTCTPKSINIILESSGKWAPYLFHQII